MDNELQFDQVQGAAGAGVCSNCRTALPGSYFQANGHVLCANCAENLRKIFQDKEGGFGRFIKATVFGIGGGIAGAAVYTTVIALSDWRVGLLAILIGWLVGKAVRKGSNGRGGTSYQILAVVITYLAIGISLMLGEMLRAGIEGYSVFKIVSLCIFGSIAGPVYEGMHSIMGAIITLIGLFEAWKLNASAQVNITGPHAMNTVSSNPDPIDPNIAQAPSVPPALPAAVPPLTPPSA